MVREWRIDSLAEFQKIAKCLAVDLRLKIYELLQKGKLNINEIATALDSPMPTITVNIQKMEDAGLIQCESVPGVRGTQKICSLRFDNIIFAPKPHETAISEKKILNINLPIGHFIDFQAEAPCGLLTEHGEIGKKDSLPSFYLNERINAQLIWMGNGFLEYKFPNEVPPNASICSIEFSAEICSEAMGYNNEWSSEITLWVNGLEVGTWESPGDFGGKRGKNTPKWWALNSTQYGLLTRWKIDMFGCYVNGIKVSDVNCHAFKIREAPYVRIKIGNKPDAEKIGGFNLFGARFGDFNQDLVLRIEYQEK
jgi:predicted transcriptional regulator